MTTTNSAGESQLRNRGCQLIDECSEHILATMRTMPECQSGETGARKFEIMRSSGLWMENGWNGAFGLALLEYLMQQQKIEILPPKGSRRYRLSAHETR